MHLLERAEFFEQLQVTFSEVLSGNGRLVPVSGEAGIGKTSLVEEFCREAEERVSNLIGRKLLRCRSRTSHSHRAFSSEDTSGAYLAPDANGRMQVWVRALASANSSTPAAVVRAQLCPKSQFERLTSALPRDVRRGYAPPSDSEKEGAMPLVRALPDGWARGRTRGLAPIFSTSNGGA